MKLIENIMILLTLFILSISHSYASECHTNPNMHGKVKKLSITNTEHRGKKIAILSVSFGNYDNVPVYHKLNDYEGMAVLELLGAAISRKATIFVNNCTEAKISSIKASTIGLSNPMPNISKEDNIEIG
ncbi:hypothetical protein ID855_02800 [Xenorhabdus sp. ZM]|uniref:hypothetical protein n=1 Tax=Xenorhabdus szentirmaii TaxID=290112 RepID=UPI0019A4C8AB|nr:hypothetical protein [Xenorhabdus sp. ZM]MBD2803655.1 hypothetical protein [Xenorhabdus sp. ZM]